MKERVIRILWEIIVNDRINDSSIILTCIIDSSDAKRISRKNYKIKL